jgi:hypothetical protein
MIPTTFDNSTSTSTIEIPIHQSLQKNSNWGSNCKKKPVTPQKSSCKFQH